MNAVQAPRAVPLRAGALLTVAVLLVGTNLRPAVTSLGSVLEQVRVALGASEAWAGVLTSLPPLCFGAAGLAAPLLTRRVGTARTIGVGLVLITAGICGRVAGESAVALLGTFVACAGIAVCNVLIPVVIKQSYPRRIGVLTGWYTAVLQGSAALGSALTPPLSEAFGGWRPALLSWASLALVALLLWAVAVRTPAMTETAADAPPRVRLRGLLRSPLAWLVTGYFGSQSFFAFIVMGWMPEVLVDAGTSRASAGVLLGVISVLGVPVSLVVVPLASRARDQAAWAVALPLLSIAGVLGLLIAPSAAPVLWALLVGTGMGSFSLAVALISLRTTDAAATETLSTMTQGIGYLFAGLGPLTFGVLHGLSGDWTVSFGLTLAVLTAQVVLGGFAGRARQI